MSVKEFAAIYGMSEWQVREICRREGSPAVKLSEKGSWYIPEKKMEKWLLKQSERYKG